MAVIRKNCDSCGQPIELRQLGPDKWKPYDPDGRRHACQGRRATGQSRTQPPPAQAAAAPPSPAAPGYEAHAAPVQAGSTPNGGMARFLIPAALLIAAAIFILPRLLGRDTAPADTAQVPAVPTMSAPPASGGSGGGQPAPTRTPRPRSTATTVPEVVPAAEAPRACAAFSNQMWAQAIFDQDPRRNAGLDPDGDGFACEELPYGAVPALWTDAIPASAEQVKLVSTIDGDTIVVRRKDGRTEHVRLVGIDTPETGKGTRPLECYGEEATDFTRQLFDTADGRIVWLEIDKEDRDRYDRLLRYVWFEHGGQVYMANDAIVRSGYAERYRDTPNRRYYQTFIDGEAFAKSHDYGLWSACR